jgi:hypothetical protein
MKMNKWTLGLAAVGLVSLTPGLLAQTAAGPVAVPVTAMSATTISGYVDTSAVWNPGSGNVNPAPYAFNNGKQDGFNLDAVDVKISKDANKDAASWSAGYNVELMYGPNATVALGTWAPIRQAYAELRIPVGNGIGVKLGQWDNVLGFEGTDSKDNLNWSRSYGYTIEPTEHIGVLAEYLLNSSVDLKVGLANELSPGLGFNRNIDGPGGSAIETKKAIVSLITLTAPDSWGALKGSALYAGADYGPGNALNHLGPGGHFVDKTHVYLGAVVMTPVTGLKLGAAWDWVLNSDIGAVQGEASTYAGYISYKLSDKATVNARAEYACGSAFDNMFGQPNGSQVAKVLAFTGTFQYDLWANVISRIEARWDTSADGNPTFGTAAAPKHNEFTVAANVIYKF